MPKAPSPMSKQRSNRWLLQDLLSHLAAEGHAFPVCIRQPAQATPLPVWHKDSPKPKIYLELPVLSGTGKTARRTRCLEPDAAVDFVIQDKWQEFFHVVMYPT